MTVCLRKPMTYAQMVASIRANNPHGGQPYSEQPWTRDERLEQLAEMRAGERKAYGHG